MVAAAKAAQESGLFNHANRDKAFVAKIILRRT